MADITAIILTKNEELNIEKCILSIKPLVKRILVINSYSTDKTVELAENLGAEVYKHTFENHAKQFIYGLNRNSRKLIPTTFALIYFNQS